MRPAESLTRRGGTWVLLALVAVLGLALRLQGISEISLWFDESFCWKVTTYPLAETAGRAARDSHPALYFLLLKLWTGAWGDSDLSLRLLSVLCGEATILGAFLLVRQAGANGWSGLAGGRREMAALAAAAFVALSPFQIHWAQQARMYALAAALAVFSGWFLLRALAHGRRSDWAGFAVCGILLAHTHYYGLFVLAAQYGFALTFLWRSDGSGTDRGARRRGLLAAGAAMAASWLPWLPTFLAQSRRVSDSYWIPAFRWETLGAACYQMFAPLENSVPSAELAWSAANLCGLVLLFLGLSGYWSDRYFALVAALPFAASAAVSLRGQSIFLTRYFVPAHVFLICGVAMLLCRIPNRGWRCAAFGAAFVAASWSCWMHLQQRSADAQLPGIRGAMAYLESQRAPDEPVLVNSPMVYPSVLAHARRRDGIRLLDRPGEYPHYQGAAVIDQRDEAGWEDVRAERRRWLWVVDNQGWYSAPELRPPEGWRLVRERRFAEFYSPDSEMIVRQYRWQPAAGNAQETDGRADSLVSQRTGGAKWK